MTFFHWWLEMERAHPLGWWLRTGVVMWLADSVLIGLCLRSPQGGDASSVGGNSDEISSGVLLHFLFALLLGPLNLLIFAYLVVKLISGTAKTPTADS